MFNITALHQIGNSADRFFNRYAQVDSSRLIKVNIVEIESLERVGKIVLHMMRGYIPYMDPSGEVNAPNFKDMKN